MSFSPFLPLEQRFPIDSTQVIDGDELKDMSVSSQLDYTRLARHQVCASWAPDDGIGVQVLRQRFSTRDLFWICCPEFDCSQYVQPF